jgi:predicted nucleic-acid-binding protein
MARRASRDAAGAIDANVILRLALKDRGEQSPRCAELFRRVEAGAADVYLPEVVVSDTIWTLTSYCGWPRERTRAFVETLVRQPGVVMAHKSRIFRALAAFVEHDVDYSDALVAAELHEWPNAGIYSFDRDFDRLPGTVRREP